MSLYRHWRIRRQMRWAVRKVNAARQYCAAWRLSEPWLYFWALRRCARLMPPQPRLMPTWEVSRKELVEAGLRR